MLRNHLAITLRTMQRTKGITVINILGLAVGMSLFLLIVQYISFETGYDAFHANLDRIYRLQNDRIYQDRQDKSAGCEPALAPTLKKEFPEVEEVTRLRATAVTVIDLDRGISDNLEKAYYAEPSLFRIFSFPMLQGSGESALEKPYSIAISAATAKKYFLDQEPLGKSLSLMNEYGTHQYVIAGVFQDTPPNSHLKFDVLMSYRSLVAQDQRADYYWGWNAFMTYILLAPQAEPGALASKFPEMIRKYKDDGDSYKRVYRLQPLRDIHLHSNLRFEPEVNGDAGTVNILSVIAAVILIIAWVNYVNLSTSRSLTRAKEVGVRKVLGTSRLQLVGQFMTESVLLNLVAVAIALLIDALALPYFKAMTGKPVSMDLLQQHWALVSAALVAGTILSGAYPAFVLSSFTPINALKKPVGQAKPGVGLRKGLVIFQFTVSIILIASTVIVYRQLSFMRNNDLGMSIDQIVVVAAPKIQTDFLSKANSFKDALLTFPGIKNAAASSTIPGKDYANASSGIRRQSARPQDGSQGLFIDIDENYFPLFHVPLAAGRNFTRESRLNQEIILNEEALRAYGFDTPESAIHKNMVFDGLDGRIVEIVGVAKDYHQKSLKSSMQPVIFNPINASDVNLVKYFSVKLDGKDIAGALRWVRSTWDRIYPHQPFVYEFLDEVFNAQYASDQQFGGVFGLFTLLAIAISCLGLLGLASHACTQRTKEIGIRKIVGASTGTILLMLIGDFLRWVLFANLIAWPLAYFAMHRWLQDFAYRTEIEWWVFLLAGGMALSIALLTVITQAIKAGTANPVAALRYE